MKLSFALIATLHLFISGTSGKQIFDADHPSENGNRPNTNGNNGNSGNIGNPGSNNGRRKGQLGKQTSRYASAADCDLDLDIQIFDDLDTTKFKPDKKACKKGKSFVGSGNNGKKHVTLVPSKGIEGAFTASVTDVETGAVYSIGPDANGDMVAVERMQEDYGDEEDPIDPMDEKERALSDALFAQENPSGGALRGSSGGNNKNRALQTKTTIDVLVLWTADAECNQSGLSSSCTRTTQTRANINGLIDLAIQETNTAYDLSGVNAELRLAHAAYTEYSASTIGIALTALRVNGDGNMDEAHSLRTQYGADAVALIVGNTFSGTGVGYVGPIKDWMFSVTKYSSATGYYTFGHEIGHNMGCNHDKATKEVCSTSNYNYGYRDPNAQFRSILSYNCKTGQCDGMPKSGCPRVQRFSNNQFLYNGKAIGNSLVDNARRINNVKDIVAGYYTATTPPPPSPSQCSGSEAPLTVEVNTDQYPRETSWTLTNTCTNSVVDSVAQGSLNTSGTKYTKNYCVLPASYRFAIKDSYGDGVCCGYGSGSYSVSYDSNVVASGGEFTSSESSTFGSSCGGGGTAFCGCSTCTQQVWDTLAGDYTCGARITWLQTAQGQSESQACSQVESEFPSICLCGC